MDRILLLITELKQALTLSLLILFSVTSHSQSCVHDDTKSDFDLGTTGSNTLVVVDGNGGVILNPTLNQDFSGGSLPSGWGQAIWDAQAGATTTYSGGQVTVDGTHVYTNSSYAPGTSIEFRATFTVGNFQNIGFTADAAFNSPWIVIGRAAPGDNQVYARTSSGQSVALGAYTNASHTYRINWNSGTNTFNFYVDGTLISTPGITQTVATNMIFQISDYPSGGVSLSTDWVRISPYAASGSYTSRVFDGGAQKTWDAITWSQYTPTNTSLSLYVRTGNTPTPDGSWSSFSNVGTSGAILNITSQYIQYRADLSTSNNNFTPILRELEILCNTPGPDVTPPVISNISASPAPNGESATITWTTNELANSLVIYGTDANALSNSQNNNSLVTSHSLTLTSLVPGTVYYYRVVSEDASGNSATSPNPPASPLSFTATWQNCFQDITSTDFNLGTGNSSTQVALYQGGEVIIKPAAGSEFTTLPSNTEWQSFAWTGGASSVSGGILSVSGSRYNSIPATTTYGPGTSIEFVATFGAAGFQHIGFGGGTNAIGTGGIYNGESSWAMFSTNNTTNTLFARTFRAEATTGTSNFTITGIPNLIGTAHRYRIDWKSNGTFEFYIDGVSVRVETIAITAQMRPAISDYNNDATPITVDWIRVSPYSGPAVFESRVYGNSLFKKWGHATWSTDLPSGTAISVSYRRGNTPTPDGTWTSYSTIGTSGDLVGGASRYIQYSAELTTSDNLYTPAFKDITIECGPANIPVAAATHDEILCNGGTAAVTISATNGTAPYSGTGTFQQVVGSHTYLVTDVYGIPDSVTVTLSEPTLLEAFESHTSLVCVGDSSDVTISANGGTASYSGTGIFKQAAGTVTYTVTDANGCSATIDATVTNPALISATISAPAQICVGESVPVVLSSGTGVEPYNVTVNGTTYNNVNIGDTIVNFLNTEVSVWGNTGTPANPSVTDNVPIEVGVKFRTSVDGYITGVRFYKGVTNTGTHIGSLWTTSGTQLATATFTSETSSGWQEVRFPSPVAVQANTTYIASYFSQGGYFAINAGFFASSGVTNGPLTALQAGVDGVNGVYLYGGGFPNNGNTANYWVDVLFTEQNNNSFHFELTELTDANGCVNSGNIIDSINVKVNPLPGGQINSNSLICAGESIDVTFNSTSGTGPFDLIINGTTYSGIDSGTTFSVGTGVAVSSSVSIWEPSSTGGTLGSPDYGSVEVGVKFRSSVGGNITGIRFYKTALNTGTHIGNLWTSAGTLLSTATFSGETPTGWQQVDFATPVTIQPNVTYVASYFAPNGNYAFNGGYFTSSGVTNGPLTALQSGVDGNNAVFNYNGTSSFPTQSFGNANYWVDVVFKIEKDTVINLTSISDANGCTTTGNPISTSTVSVKSTNGTITAQTNALCYDDANGSVTALGFDGLSPYEYKLDNGSYQPNGTFSNLHAGTYLITIKDANGCTKDTSITITQPNVLEAFESHTTLVCYGDSSDITISATGGTTPYTGTGVFKQAAGTVTYTVTDANGCSTTVDATITQPDLITATINAPSQLCAGEYIPVILSSATGLAPYTVVLNGQTYTNLQVGDTISNFASGETSIWGNTGTPANPNVTDNTPIETGVKFRTSVDGFINGVRFYKGVSNTGTHIGSLWNSSGTQLATATFTSETSSGWQEVRFASPVAIQANTTYIASYFSQGGYFAIDAGFFASSGVTNGPLTALQAGVDGVNGVYFYGGGFPNNGNTANYWVDVLFTEQGASSLHFDLTQLTDANGCVNTGSIIDSTTVIVNPLPKGTISTNGIVCKGESIDVTFNSTSGVGPFDLVINGNTYTNISSGNAFSVGTAVVSNSSISIWDPSTVGSTAPSPDYSPVEVGVKFRSNIAGKITSIRFYKTALNTGTHIGNLWTSAGTLLATATFTSETATGWQQVDFSTPVSIQPNVTYVASYFAPNGNYAFNGNYFGASGTTNGSLTALQSGVDGNNGVFNYVGTTAFPNQSFNNANYWIDVVFSYEQDTVINLTSISDANGCTTTGSPISSNTIAIKHTDGWITAQSNVLCFGDSTGSITVAGFDGLAPYEYKLDNGSYQSSGIFSNLPIGSYSITIKDANGCTKDTSTTITQPDLLQLSQNHTTILCYGDSATVSISATGGVGPYSGTGDFQQTAGSVTYTVTDANGCSSTIEVTLSEPDTLIASASNAEILCFGGSTSVTISATGGTPPYTGTGVFQQAVGTHIYTVTDSNGCSSDVSVTVTEPLELQASESHTTIVCHGGTSVVTISANGGTAPYTGTGNFNQLAGTHIYQVADANGCTSDVSVTITEPDAVTGTISVPANICPGDPITLTLSSANLAGPYSVTVNNENYNNLLVGDTIATFIPYESSIWGTSGTPANPSVTDNQSIEIGVKFRASADGYITGVRFYKGITNTGTHIAHLWTTAQTLLATATFTAETASGWQEVRFSSPVPIQANQTYVASYYSQEGYFAITANFFASSGVTNGPLTALQAGVEGSNGVYRYGGGYPNNGGTANYWVDVLFSEFSSNTSATYYLTSVSDSNSCTTNANPIDSTTVFIRPIPTGSLVSNGAACAGDSIYLTFDATAGTSPFDLNVNGNSFTGVGNSTPFAVGVASIPPAGISVWSPSTVGGEPGQFDNSAVELGVKFRTSIAGLVTGIRFYKRTAQTGTHTGTLWSSNGTILATATFTNETASGWQQVDFSTPVSIQPGTTYIASYHTPNGNYAFTANYFTSNGPSNGPLTAIAAGVDGPNGVYRYGNGGVVPNDSYQNSNYWVDVVFSYGQHLFYDLTHITDNYGCVSSQFSTADIRIDTTIHANAGPDVTTTLCDGLLNVTLQANNPGVGIAQWSQLSDLATTFTPNNTTNNATATSASNGLKLYEWKIENGVCTSKDTVAYFFDPAITADATVANCGFLEDDSVLINVVITGGTSPFTILQPGTDNIRAEINELVKIYAAPLDGLSHQYTIVDSANCSLSSSSITPAGQPTDIPLITGNADSITVECYSDRYNKWLTFRDDNNDAIVSINDSAQNLGLLTVTVYRDDMEPSVATSGAICTPFTDNKAMKRHFVVKSTAPQPFNRAVGVRLYFSDDELQSLITASQGNDVANQDCSLNDNVNTINDLYVTKYSGANEDGDYLNNSVGGIYKVYGNNSLTIQPNGTLAKEYNGFNSIYTNGNNHHYVELSVNEFSEFWLHGSQSGAPLPVELLYLEANAINNTFIRVKWATAIEINNHGFSIERSTDGQTWSIIGWVDGNDNSTRTIEYKFDDKDATKGIRYYYRLKQVDNDEQFSYTSIVSAMLSGEVTFTVGSFSPNPTVERSTVKITASDEQEVQIDVYNSVGQKVTSQINHLHKGDNDIILAVNNLATDTYSVIIRSEKEFYSRKLVVTH